MGKIVSIKAEKGIIGQPKRPGFEYRVFGTVPEGIEPEQVTAFVLSQVSWTGIIIGNLKLAVVLRHPTDEPEALRELQAQMQGGEA